MSPFDFFVILFRIGNSEIIEVFFLLGLLERENAMYQNK